MNRSILFTVFAILAFASPSLAQAPFLDIKQDTAVIGLAWSADGKRLASAWQDGIIRITEIPSGKEVCKLNIGVPVAGLVFSPDGKLLGLKSGARDRPLMVWDVATQRKLRELAYQGYLCNQLAFSPDGQNFVASGPGDHMVWQHIKGSGYGSRMANVPLGSSAAVAANAHIVGWCNPQGNVQLHHVVNRRYLHMKIGPTRAIAFSPDAHFLAAAAMDKTIRLWTVVPSALVRKFEGLREPANLLHFSANGKVLAAASPGDPVVRLWDVKTTRLRRRLTATSAGVRALALSPDGMTLAIASGNHVYLWNVTTRDVGNLGKPLALSATEMKTAWEDLASKDQAQAESAFRRLATAQNHAVDFLKKEVRAVAVPYVDKKRVAKLLQELDSPKFQVRQNASQELAKLGELVQPDLEKILAAKPSLERSRRIRKLLERLRDPELTPDRLRCLETIEILEIWHTPEARNLLEEFARDALINQIRAAAREALARLQRSKEKA
jgi:WD40 repeat protein